MKYSEALVGFIKQEEGFRATPYRDASGILTVGYGQTGHDVTPGMQVSPAEAELMLRAELEQVSAEVVMLVRVPLNQGQFDALCDFVYNCGAGQLKSSELLRRLNHGDVNGAAEQFPLWVHVGNRVMPGLVKRRMAEQSWFLAGSIEAANQQKQTA